MSAARSLALLAAPSLFGCLEPETSRGEIGIYDASVASETTADVSTRLTVNLEVQGNGQRCGGCMTLLAEASGGAPPYRYAWSDPALEGPGPHAVCPEGDVSYAVSVTSASADQTIATASLKCTPPDAGPPDLTVLDGCKALPPETGDDHLTCDTDAGAALDGGAIREAHSDRITFLVTPGQTYEYVYDMVVPVGLGPDSTVDVYGARSPCGLDEKMFTITLASIPHQTFCFTPSFQYVYSTALVRVNGIPFSFGTSPTVCSRCSPDAGAPP